MYFFSESQKLYQRAVAIIPRGTHSDSRARLPHPIYFRKAEGAWVEDVDGNRLLDCSMGNGAVILGHGNAAVRRAVQEQLASGMVHGLEGELSVVVAEEFLRQVRTAECVRFSNTGTEAMMHAIAMARAATGRSDVAKPEGSYHGWYDFVFVSTWPDLARAGIREAPVSLPGSPGLSAAAVNSTLVFPFNDLPRTEALLRENANRLAAIIIEPVMIDIGWVPASPLYLHKLRELATELDIVLIFDELLTGFRMAPGGAQQFYGISPDLSIFGKAMGNGYVISAVAGRRALMDPLPGAPRALYVGTFNSHPVGLAASRAVLEILRDGTVLAQLKAVTEMLIERFAEMARRHGVNARMVGGGGHIHWYFNEGEIHDYRSAACSDPEAYQTFQSALWQHGILSSPNYLQHHCISAAHGDREIELLLRAMDAGLEAVARSQTKRREHGSH